MRKCAKCGKENIDKAIYCANCGARLDSISKKSNSNSSSTPSPALNALKDHIAEDSSSSSSGGGSNSNSTIIQKTEEGPNKLKICCCYVPVILFVAFMIFALVFHGAAESFPTSYSGDYSYLDLNGDGKLTFNEASQIDLDIDDSNMTEYFNEADTNGNGYLKGHEFDLFCDDVKSHRSRLRHSSSDSDKYKYSSSSSSKSKSSSSNSYSSSSSLNNQEFDSSSEGYVLTCPYCGSEAIYETGGYYKCAECGNSIYDPDDLELAYIDGYMDLLAPISLILNQ